MSSYQRKSDLNGQFRSMRRIKVGSYLYTAEFDANRRLIVTVSLSNFVTKIALYVYTPYLRLAMQRSYLYTAEIDTEIVTVSSCKDKIEYARPKPVPYTLEKSDLF